MIALAALLPLSTVLVEIAVLIIIALRRPGQARLIGLIGAVVLVIGAIGSAAVILLLPRLILQFHLSYAAYSLANLPVVLLHGAAIVLLAVAAGSNARDTSPR